MSKHTDLLRVNTQRYIHEQCYDVCQFDLLKFCEACAAIGQDSEMVSVCDT